MAPDRFDIFGTFLQTTPPPRSSAPPALLHLLRTRGGRVGYAELWRDTYRSGHTQQEFSDALRQLIDRKLAALEYPPNAPWPDVSLTAAGVGAAEILARG